MARLELEVPTVDPEVVGQMTALDGRGRGTKRIAPAIGSAGNTRGTSAARIRA